MLPIIYDGINQRNGNSLIMKTEWKAIMMTLECIGLVLLALARGYDPRAPHEAGWGR